jgi:predicted glutamine amidotransferase
MCELMGLCFARPVSADFSIREFAQRGRENADGWGLAWYPDRAVAVVKEPVRWQDSTYTGFLESYQGLRSSLYVAHVRHKTVGGPPTHADTHPFARELGGREYCFAHNGTLDDVRERLPLGRFRPVGGTDSEHAFCHLLEDVARREDALATPASWEWLHSRLAALNRLGKLNCLLSDGSRLFCYFDAAGHKGLTMRKVRVRGPGQRHLEDEELSVDLAGGDANHGFVVASQPLSPTGWHPFHPGELIVLSDRGMCYSSHRRGQGAGHSPL